MATESDTELQRGFAMKLSVNQAADIVDVVRQTMYKHIKSRGISTETDANGEMTIDISELIRVYGNDVVAKGMKRQEEEPRTVAPRQVETVPGATATMVSEQVQLVRLEAKVEKFQALAEKAEEATAYIKDLFEAEKTERQQATRLLEDLRAKEGRAGELEQSLKALEARLNTYEQADLERRRKVAIARRKREADLRAQLQAANNRPWYQKLFG